MPEITEGFYCHPGDANTPQIIFTRSDGLGINAGFELGFTSVTASFTDLYGVSTSCTFDIEVKDEIDPFCMLKEVTLSVDAAGELSVEGAIINDGSFDNCTNVDIESYHASNKKFHL